MSLPFLCTRCNYQSHKLEDLEEHFIGGYCPMTEVRITMSRSGDFSLPRMQPVLKCPTWGWDEQGKRVQCQERGRGDLPPHVHTFPFNTPPTRREIVIAYRVFNVTLPKGELYAVSALVARVGETIYFSHTKSSCPVYHYPGPICMNEQVPLWAGHGDGFYSYKSPAHAIRDKPIFPVIGKVALLGRVIEHEIGYRSQGVRIEELWVTGKNWEQTNSGAWVPRGVISDSGTFFTDSLTEVARQLSQRYDCDCGILIDTKDWEEIK